METVEALVAKATDHIHNITNTKLKDLSDKLARGVRGLR